MSKNVPQMSHECPTWPAWKFDYVRKCPKNVPQMSHECPTIMTIMCQHKHLFLILQLLWKQLLLPYMLKMRPGETAALAFHAKLEHQGSYFGWNAQFILKRINRMVYPILRVSELQYFSSDSGLITSDLVCNSSDLMLNTSDFQVEFCTFRFWIFAYHPIFAIYAIFSHVRTRYFPTFCLFFRE